MVRTLAFDHVTSHGTPALDHVTSHGTPALDHVTSHGTPALDHVTSHDTAALDHVTSHDTAALDHVTTCCVPTTCDYNFLTFLLRGVGSGYGTVKGGVWVWDCEGWGLGMGL